MKIAWLTDIHLNFLDANTRVKFYNHVNESGVEKIIITGDIAEAKDVCGILEEFSRHVSACIYFVLGNHDYYFGSVESVRKDIRALCNQKNQLIWLGKPEIISLSDVKILVGHDGGADARYGDFEHSTVSLNDSRLIAELYQAFLLNKAELKRAMQKLADEDASILLNTLENAIHVKAKEIIIATHVPPFPECSWHRDRPSDKDWLPYFASKAMGDVIKSVADQNEDIQFLVLCGHTHAAKAVQISNNLSVRVGAAEYYKPNYQLIEV